MNIEAEVVDRQSTVHRYGIRYPIHAYTFPKDALIHEVNIDASHIQIELTDGRVLSIPLWWIPTVYNAAPEDRAKFRINRGRTMIVWDPDEGPINDELRIQDYLAPYPSMTG